LSKKTIVSIVSDQTIPNVLFIKEITNKYKIDKFFFLTTEGIEKKNKTAHIIEGANITHKENIKILVPEDNIKEMESILGEKIRGSYKYIVNITGGTKMMAIAAYNFFKERDSEIYYLPVGKNIYKKLHPYSEKREKDLIFRITLKEYLKSSGIDVKLGKLHQSKKNTEMVFNKFTNNKIDKELINIIRKELRNTNKKKIKKMLKKGEYPLDKEYINIFKEFGIEKEKISNYDVEYITGGWFEEYIFNRIKSELKIKNDYIGINVLIKREDVDSELDVMFTYDNALYVIECKTSLKNNGKSIFSDTIYKLSALKKDFGLFVKAFIFTLDEVKENSANRKRANYFGINIFDKTSILNKKEIFNLRS